MAITAAQKALLNKMNRTAATVQLGTLLETAETNPAEVTLTEGTLLVGDADDEGSELALTSTQIIVGSSAGVATARTVTGDVTISNTGVTAIGADKVTKAMIAATVRPSHRVVFAGEFTTAGGDADEAITATGALATDYVVCNLKTKGITPRTILTAAAATDAVNVVMSGDPSTDHVIQWFVMRATT